jgi:hypothetical protein
VERIELRLEAVAEQTLKRRDVLVDRRAELTRRTIEPDPIPESELLRVLARKADQLG